METSVTAGDQRGARLQFEWMCLDPPQSERSCWPQTGNNSSTFSVSQRSGPPGCLGTTTWMMVTHQVAVSTGFHSPHWSDLPAAETCGQDLLIKHSPPAAKCSALRQAAPVRPCWREEAGLTDHILLPGWSAGTFGTELFWCWENRTEQPRESACEPAPEERAGGWGL